MLLFFYFSPLPEQILTFFAGSLKYNFKKFIIYMGIAILIKYTLLSIYGIKLIEYFTSFIANLI
jgi:membrane protein YqaA with SNARE-associated domain